jgi:hypothetical protein
VRTEFSIAEPGDYLVHADVDGPLTTSASAPVTIVAALPELGGVGLFVAVERMTSTPLPCSLAGQIDVPPTDLAPDGDAVYLFARELGDAKVWTSPLFIQRVT